MARRALNILLVDDDTDVLDMIGMFLEMDDARVTSATGYHDALEKLEESDFDIVITDWRMPKMHGLYLLEMIKDNWPDMPVIIMSAYISDEMETEAKKKKVDLMLKKPFEYQELHAGILKLVKK